MLAQTADLDIWRHPITLLLIAAILGGIGTAVGFALRQIITSQRQQDAKLAEVATSIAVGAGVSAAEATHRELRMVRIEGDISGVRSDVGALHRRLDDTISQLSAGNPEVRP